MTNKKHSSGPMPARELAKLCGFGSVKEFTQHIITTDLLIGTGVYIRKGVDKK